MSYGLRVQVPLAKLLTRDPLLNQQSVVGVIAHPLRPPPPTRLVLTSARPDPYQLRPSPRINLGCREVQLGGGVGIRGYYFTHTPKIGVVILTRLRIVVGGPSLGETGCQIDLTKPKYLWGAPPTDQDIPISPSPSPPPPPTYLPITRWVGMNE